jgi:hypothetical protein
MSKLDSASFNELYDLIIQTESELYSELESLWRLIRIPPEKWKVKEYGEGYNFWVVAIFGREVIWYNDIEGGFYIGEYAEYGRAFSLISGQQNLTDMIQIVHGRIKAL